MYVRLGFDFVSGSFGAGGTGFEGGTLLAVADDDEVGGGMGAALGIGDEGEVGLEEARRPEGVHE